MAEATKKTASDELRELGVEFPTAASMAKDTASQVFEIMRPESAYPSDPRLRELGVVIGGSPTVSDRVTEAAYRTGQGIVETSPAVAGGIGGLRLGQMTGNPAVAATMAGLGFTAGLVGGQTVSDRFFLKPPEEERPYAEAFKTFGASIPFMGLPYAGPGQRIAGAALFRPVTPPAELAKIEAVIQARQAGKGGPLPSVGEFVQAVDQAVFAGKKAALTAPKVTAGQEVMAGTGAGTGAFIAEQFPGSDILGVGPQVNRMLWETGLGTFSPLNIIAGYSGNVGDTVKNMVSRFTTKEGVLNRSGALLQEYYDKRGTDTNELLRILEDPSAVSTLTTVEKLGDFADVGRLANMLKEQSKVLGGEMALRTEQNVRSIANLINLLGDVGTPDALALAAGLRENMFKDMLKHRATIAYAEAAQANAKIPKDRADAADQLGVRTRGIMQSSLDDARTIERFFWDLVPKRVEAQILEIRRQISAGKIGKKAGDAQIEQILESNSIKPEQFIKAYEDLMADMSVAESMPAGVTALYTKYRKAVASDDELLSGIAGSDTAQGRQYSELLSERDQLSVKRNQTEMFSTTREGRQVVSGNYEALNDRLADVNNKIAKFEVEALKQIRQQGALSVGDIVGDRGALLRQLRDATSKDNNANNARIFQRLEGALLDDLGNVRNKAADTARAYSRTLNDFFTRNFVNDVLMFDRTGGPRISPELVLGKAFTGNPQVTALRFKEMEDAVNMIPALYDEAATLGGPGAKDRLAAITPKILADSADRVVSFNDAAGRYLRLLVNNFVDPDTNRVTNPEGLRRFVNKNKEVFQRFGLADIADNPRRLEESLRTTLDANKPENVQQRISELAFANLIGNEKPYVTIENILSQKNPKSSQELRRLVQFAKAADSTLFQQQLTRVQRMADDATAKAAELEQAGIQGPELDGLTQQARLYRSRAAELQELLGLSNSFTGPPKPIDAMKGLQKAFHDYAFMNASGSTDPATGGGFDWKKYYDTFFAPLRPREPSLSQTLVDAGVFTGADMNRLKTMLGEARRIQESPKFPGRAEEGEVLKRADMFTDLALRLIGTRMYSGSSLVMEAAMSRFMRNLFDNMPVEGIRRTIEQSMLDPQLHADLLRRGGNARQVASAGRRVFNALYGAGITAMTPEDLSEEEDRLAATPPTMAERTVARMERKLPPAPQARGLLSSFAPAQQPGRPQARTPAGQPQPQAREMLQRLFPFDAVLR